MNLHAPINSLSIGNVSYNFARSLNRLGSLDGFFPLSDNKDFSAFEDDSIIQKLSELEYTTKENVLKNDSSLMCWHINGSQFRTSSNSFLYTFYEVDSPTKAEINLVNLHKHVFFSSQESADLFEAAGCENVSYVPLGFDENIAKNDVFAPKDKDVVNFILIGKLEQRKNTKTIIESWLEEYGNNNKYTLTCLVDNPFLPDRYISQFKTYCLNHQGKVYSNLNFLPRLKENSKINAIYNWADIDLSGLSSGEGWNLPSFNVTCLGKWSVVSNCSGHKGWANDSNSILVEPVGKSPCYDGQFFQEGSQFNQGSYYKIDKQDMKEGMAKAVKRHEEGKNTYGLKMQEALSYENSVKSILKTVDEKS